MGIELPKIKSFYDYFLNKDLGIFLGNILDFTYEEDQRFLVYWCFSWKHYLGLNLSILDKKILDFNQKLV